AALADHGLPAPSRDDVRDWVGGGARNLVAQAAPAAQVEPVLAGFLARYAAAPTAHSKLYAGLGPVLDRLASSNRVLAVLTNKPHELAVRISDELLAPWPFALIAGHSRSIP